MRSKANLLSSGSSRGEEAVQRTRAAARQVLEMKYPNMDISHQAISKTAPLEIKYQAFVRDSIVTKTRDLDKLEVKV